MPQAQIEQQMKEAKVLAAVSYWGFFCILPLVLMKNNKFAVYHGKQGLVLFIFLVAGFIVSILPVLGPMIYRLVLFIYLVLLLWGSIAALAGKKAPIPFVSKIAENITS
jgi:fumarate reductase subunit D